jgi:uncharacterized phage infection (PIP) family protein YhgE
MLWSMHAGVMICNAANLQDSAQQAAITSCNCTFVPDGHSSKLLFPFLLPNCCRERKKQKYCNLQGTVDELSVRLSQLNTLEAANSELQQRNGQLEGVVKQQQVQLQQQQDTISKQAQQLQTQAQQLAHQAQQLQSQVLHIEQQDKQLAELKGRVAAAGSSSSQQQPADADQLNDQLALAVRAVLTGVSSMTSMLPAKDAQQMQQVVTTLPDSILQQIRSCCREVALHLKKTEVKEMPHAVQVPCC